MDALEEIYRKENAESTEKYLISEYGYKTLAEAVTLYIRTSCGCPEQSSSNRFFSETMSLGEDTGHVMGVTAYILQFQKWKNSKQQYCFGKNMIHGLLETQWDNTIPADVLWNLPVDTMLLDFKEDSELVKILHFDSCLLTFKHIQGFWIILMQVYEKQSRHFSKWCAIPDETSSLQFDKMVFRSFEDETKELFYQKALFIMQTALYLCSKKTDLQTEEKTLFLYQKAVIGKKRQLLHKPIRYKLSRRKPEHYDSAQSHPQSSSPLTINRSGCSSFYLEQMSIAEYPLLIYQVGKNCDFIQNPKWRWVQKQRDVQLYWQNG